MTTEAVRFSDLQVELPRSPYPGLRPFEKAEWPIFFGREPMVDEVIHRLVSRQFVVVHGDSGCGKSSLIKAGVLARLEQESARGGLAWRTCEFRPHSAPLQQMAAALAAAGRQGTADAGADTLAIRRVLNFGPSAPADLAESVRRHPTEHVCLLIDQFEEVFSARRSSPTEVRLLIDFLVALCRKPPAGLYVIATMRSEFLGACAQFEGFAEAVNEVQYLLPRMSHASLVRAIREPAALYGGCVSRELADQLIADAGREQDSLPLIQHGLMRIHRLAAAQSGNPDGWKLDVSDYRSVGGNLAELLSMHADELAGVAEQRSPGAIERLFRALIDVNAEGQAIRRPQRFAALVDVTGIPGDTLLGILDLLRAADHSFLSPYSDKPIADDTRIDVSHEALIRCWRRIADQETGWLSREFQDGLVWKSLLIQADSFERDPSNVLSPAAAEERSAWLADRTKPWAERYGGGWHRVEELLRASVKAASAKRRQLTIMVSTAATTLALALSFFIGLYRQEKRALASATAATATTLWNRLDFASSGSAYGNDESNALWELAGSNPEIRAAFVQELRARPERVTRLGARPAAILRSMAVRWRPQDAEALLEPALAAIASQPDEAVARGRAAAALAALVSANQAHLALLSSWSRLTPQEPENVRRAFALAAAALAARLDKGNVAEHKAKLLTALSSTPATPGNTGCIAELAFVAAYLPEDLSEQDGGTVMARLLDTPNWRGFPLAEFDFRWQAARALMWRVAPATARAALSKLAEVEGSLSTIDELAAELPVGEARLLLESDTKANPAKTLRLIWALSSRMESHQALDALKTVLDLFETRSIEVMPFLLNEGWGRGLITGYTQRLSARMSSGDAEAGVQLVMASVRRNAGRTDVNVPRPAVTADDWLLPVAGHQETRISDRRGGHPAGTTGRRRSRRAAVSRAPLLRRTTSLLRAA